MRGSGAAVLEIAIAHRGERVTVQQNEGHPEQYLWIFVGERRFFLGSLTRGMTRGDVRAMARRWMDEHPQHFQ